MDLIDLLENDHREVDELFRRFQLASKPETLEEISGEIVHELSIHAAVEELFVYPLVRARLEDGGEHADHAIEEHAEVKQLLADVEQLEAGSREHTDRMTEVIESVRHHVREEEGNVLAQLRDRTEPGTRETVGDLVERSKKAVPTRPHPMVPGTATAQLAAGPWVAMVDKARDLLSS